MNHKNEQIIEGNVCKEPDLKYSPSGTACLNFDIAHERWILKAGERVKRVIYFKIRAYAHLAEHVAEIITLGDRLLINGRADVEKWTSKETGLDHHQNVIVMSEFEIVE